MARRRKHMKSAIARAEADAPRPKRKAPEREPATPEWKDTDPPFMRAIWERDAPPPLHTRPEFIDRMERWQKKKDYQHDARSKRRATRVGVEVGNVARAWIIERDESTCYLCGKVCDRSEIHIDHIVPISKGGPHIESNLAVTCRTCNIAKRDTLTDKRPKALG